MSDREDFERATGAHFHETMKIRVSKEKTPRHVKVLYALMIIFLGLVSIGMALINSGVVR